MSATEFGGINGETPKIKLPKYKQKQKTKWMNLS